MSADKPAGMGAGKIVLIVVAVLFGLGLLCCAGCWFSGGNLAWKIAKPQIVMNQQVSAELGPGASVAVVPDQTAQNQADWFIVVQWPGEATPERIAKAQDAAWKAYAKEFADGGVAVKRVVFGHGGSAETVVSAEDVAKRTGIPAPAEADWARDLREKMVKEGVKVEVEPNAPPAREGTTR